MTPSKDLVSRIEADFAASYWLKGAVRSAMNRDILDALNDAETLVTVLRTRLNEVLPKRTWQGAGAPR